MGIFLIILIIVVLCWPWISRYISRMVSNFMSHRAEDMMRRMMGMPSRKEERKNARRRDNAEKKSGTYSGRSRAHRHNGATHPAQLLKSVAEDAEYVEIKEFDSTTIVEDDGATRRIYHEEQVSDVEYTEIKTRS